MQRVVVVGGGVLGMMHAAAARQRGYQVVQREREAGARRNRAELRADLGERQGARPGADQAEQLLGSALPPARRRRAGVYSQVTGPDLYLRAQLAPDVVLVTGPGGPGMTLAPAIAEQTFGGA